MKEPPKRTRIAIALVSQAFVIERFGSIGQDNETLVKLLGQPKGEEPKAAAKQPSTSTLDQVEARDRAVLLRIRNAGPAGRSMRELMISMSDESESGLEASLDRLRIKKAIRADGEKWVAA